MNVCSVGKLFFFIVFGFTVDRHGHGKMVSHYQNYKRFTTTICMFRAYQQLFVMQKTSFDLITLFTAKQLDQSVVVHTMEPSGCLICNIIFCVKTSYSVDAKIVRLTTIDMATPYMKIVCQHLRYKIDANFLSHLSHKKVRTFYMVY